MCIINFIFLIPVIISDKDESESINQFGRSPLQHFPLVTGDSSTLLTIHHNIQLSSSGLYYNMMVDIITSYSMYSGLSVNGTLLMSNGAKFNLSQTIMEPNRLIQEISFQYGISDEGYYIQHLYNSDTYSVYQVLRDHGYRCYDHRNYVQRYLWLRSVSFANLPFTLNTYSNLSMDNCMTCIIIISSLCTEPPSISFSSSYDAETGIVLLDCTAVGGVPDSHNITLILPNQHVNTKGNNNLHAYFARGRFGEFICIVESLYNTTQTSLFLEERGTTHIISSCMCVAHMLHAQIT